MIDRQRLRNEIGCFDVEPAATTSDNLAIVLCTYFEHHMDRPKPDPQTENGWGEWAEQQTNRVLDELTEFVIKHLEAKPTPLTYETFWQRVRETGWNPSPAELRKMLLEAEAGDCPACNVGNPGVYMKDGVMVCPHRPSDNPSPVKNTDR